MKIQIRDIFLILSIMVIGIVIYGLYEQDKEITALETKLSNFKSNFEEAGHYNELIKARDIILAYEKNYEAMENQVEIIRQLFINDRIMQNKKMSITEMKEIRNIIGKPDGIYYEVRGGVR